VGESGEKWFFVFTFTPSNDKKVSQLHGEYECKLDAKGRLIIPAALKKQLPKAAKDSFFINRGFEKCCVLYPSNEWEIIAIEINKLSDYIKKEREFKRYFLRGASQLEMDTNSRVNLPKSLLEYAGIGNEVMLLAYGNKIEIWSKAAYEKMLSEEPEDFSALAEEVMSKRPSE
jgi:MraZ protein